MFTEFTGLSMFPAILKQLAHLLKLRYQLGGNTSKGWGKILQHVMYALNQHPLYGTVSPIARIPESSNQNVDVGVAPLTISPSVRFLSLQTYYLCWPSGLGCKRKSISTRRPQWVH